MHKRSVSKLKKPPLLPIGAERAIRLRTAQTLRQKQSKAAGEGTDEFTPQWGRPFKPYFTLTKMQQPEGTMNRPQADGMSGQGGSAGDPEQQAPDQPNDPKQQREAAEPSAGPYNYNYNYNYDGEPANDITLEYTNDILYSELVRLQTRSGKLAQKIRDALPTHLQRQLFQQELVGQHLMAERKICKLLEGRHKAIFEKLPQKRNQQEPEMPAKHKKQSKTEQPQPQPQPQPLLQRQPQPQPQPLLQRQPQPQPQPQLQPQNSNQNQEPNNAQTTLAQYQKQAQEQNAAKEQIPKQNKAHAQNLNQNQSQFANQNHGPFSNLNQKKNQSANQNLCQLANMIQPQGWTQFVNHNQNQNLNEVVNQNQYQTQNQSPFENQNQKENQSQLANQNQSQSQSQSQGQYANENQSQNPFANQNQSQNLKENISQFGNQNLSKLASQSSENVFANLSLNEYYEMSQNLNKALTGNLRAGQTANQIINQFSEQMLNHVTNQKAMQNLILAHNEQNQNQRIIYARVGNQNASQPAGSQNRSSNPAQFPNQKANQQQQQQHYSHHNQAPSASTNRNSNSCRAAQQAAEAAEAAEAADILNDIPAAWQLQAAAARCAAWSALHSATLRRSAEQSAAQRPWQRSKFSTPPPAPATAPPMGSSPPFGSPQNDDQGSPNSSEGTLTGSPTATITGSPTDTSEANHRGTSLLPTPQAPPRQKLTILATPADPKANTPWIRKPNKAACTKLQYQEPSQWPPIGTTVRGGQAAPAGLQQVSSSTSLAPNPWPLIGGPARPASTSRGPAPSTSRTQAPRSTSRAAKRHRLQRSTSRAHRKQRPSVVLGCTPWAHLKAQSGQPKGQTAGEQKMNGAGQQQQQQQQRYNNRVYGGIPSTETSSVIYTGLLPTPAPLRVQMPQIVEDQQLGSGTAKQMNVAQNRQYTTIQKRPQTGTK